MWNSISYNELTNRQILSGARLERLFKPCTIYELKCIMLELEDYYVEIYS